MNYAEYSSRSFDDLHPKLVDAFKRASKVFKESGKFPDLTPSISQTSRDSADQNKFLDAGKSRAHYGQSAHNYNPALAFDLFFSKNGKTNYDMDAIRCWAKLVKEYNVEWSGDWHNTFEYVHFQYPGIQYELSNLVGTDRLKAIEEKVGSYSSDPDREILDQISLLENEIVRLKKMVTNGASQ